MILVFLIKIPAVAAMYDFGQILVLFSQFQVNFPFLYAPKTSGFLIFPVGIEKEY